MCVLIDIVASIVRINPSAIIFSESVMPNAVIIIQYRNNIVINNKMYNIVNL